MSKTKKTKKQVEKPLVTYQQYINGKKVIVEATSIREAIDLFNNLKTKK